MRGKNVINNLVRPSVLVKEVMEKYFSHLKKFKENEKENHMIALVIRTGLKEYNQFLSPGDETIFVKCLQQYIRLNSYKHAIIFVTSDTNEVKQNTINELLRGNQNFYYNVTSLDDSIIHVMTDIKSKETNVNLFTSRIIKTFAEYFIISTCDVMFLTHGSLFGTTAAERSKKAELFFISDSKCDGKREKYSYLNCHKPKYPEFCKIY